MINDANNRVQGTRHKVSGPLTRDVLALCPSTKPSNSNGAQGTSETNAGIEPQ